MEIHNALKHEHKFLIIEPKGHVTVEEFTRTIFIAKENCFATIEMPKARSIHIALLQK